MRISKLQVFSLLLVSLMCAGGALSYYFRELPPENPYPVGYCEKENRFLSDKEFVDIAVEMRDRRAQGARESKGDFDITNPNCCRVTRDPNLSRFKEENGLADIPMVVVKLNNQTSQKDINDFNNNDMVLILPCGKVVKVMLDYPGR